MDLNEIIAEATRGALGDSDGDEPDSPVESTETETTEVAPAATEEKVVEAAPEKAPEPDEVAKMLEEHGVQRGKGLRENLFKYSKVRKILDNQRKKLTDGHTAELTKTQGELQAVRKQMEAFQRADKLAETDADRYMELLSTIHPQYKRFLQNPAAAAAAPEKPKEAALDLTDMPKPDSPEGYTDAGLAKLMAWSASKARAEAEASLLPKFKEELDKRFKPLDDGRRAFEYRQQEGKKVSGQIAAARERWGALLDTHEKDIIKLIETDQNISFEAAVETVLIPKLLADKTKVREEVLAELKARPKAASPNGGTSSSATVSNAPRSTEDIIKDSLAALPR